MEKRQKMELTCNVDDVVCYTGNQYLTQMTETAYEHTACVRYSLTSSVCMRHWLRSVLLLLLLFRLLSTLPYVWYRAPPRCTAGSVNTLRFCRNLLPFYFSLWNMSNASAGCLTQIQTDAKHWGQTGRWENTCEKDDDSKQHEHKSGGKCDCINQCKRRPKLILNALMEIARFEYLAKKLGPFERSSVAIARPPLDETPLAILNVLSRNQRNATHHRSTRNVCKWFSFHLVFEKRFEPWDQMHAIQN